MEINMKYLLVCLLLVLNFDCFADFTKNLRWSLDGSARLNLNDAIDNTSRIYALGLDTHKVFTGVDGDVGYGVGQVYYTKLSNLCCCATFFFGLRQR